MSNNKPNETDNCIIQSGYALKIAVFDTHNTPLMVKIN